MNITNILNILYTVIVFLITVVPLVIALITTIKRKIKLRKQLRDATDEAEQARLIALQAEATNEMNEICATFISNAEMLYNDVNTLLKKEGKSAGTVKKDSVMSKLQAYALEKGYAFDAAYWSEKIDQTIALTREVNV